MAWVWAAIPAEGSFHTAATPICHQSGTKPAMAPGERVTSSGLDDIEAPEPEQQHHTEQQAVGHEDPGAVALQEPE